MIHRKALIALFFLVIYIGLTPYVVPASSPKDGVYTGHDEIIDVAVTFKDAKITKITVLEHRYGAKEYDDKIQPLILEIIEKQSTKVDAVTGASLSSAALKNAVKQAIKRASE